MQMEQPKQLRRRQKQQPHRSCARCGSDDTKFCYFNNYTTSQPRYYCKTCKRYWTHGGALRNIPEGSGCRRGKNTKKNAEPSPQSPVFAASASAILKQPPCAGMTMPQLYRQHYGGIGGGFAWGFRSNPAAAMLMIHPGGGGGGGWPPNHRHHNHQEMNHSCALAAAAPPPPPPACDAKIINGDESSEGGMSDWEIDELLLAVMPSSFML